MGQPSVNTLAHALAVFLYLQDVPFGTVLKAREVIEPALAYEYVPRACAFHRTDADVRRTHLAGLECWASDLDAVIAGELGPIALTYGRSSLWNALPTRLHFDLFSDLYRVSHPLRRPAATLRVYERLLAATRDIEPQIMLRTD